MVLTDTIISAWIVTSFILFQGCSDLFALLTDVGFLVLFSFFNYSAHYTYTQLYSSPTQVLCNHTAAVGNGSGMPLWARKGPCLLTPKPFPCILLLNMHKIWKFIMKVHHDFWPLRSLQTEVPELMNHYNLL